MGILGRDWALDQLELKPGPWRILVIAGRDCIDETGWLKYSMPELAAACGMSHRTLERTLPVLAGLRFLVRGDGGFRLTAFVEHRQNGGQVVRQIAEEKESNKEKEEFCLINTNTPPLSPASGGKKTRRERLQEEREAQREVTTHPALHFCDQCAVPHEWVCSDPFCGCYRREKVCAAAVESMRLAVGARSP